MNKIILILILIFFIVKLIQCNEINIIELKTDNSIYIKNPDKSKLEFCSFSFTFLTIFPESQFDTFGQINAIFDSAPFEQFYLQSNETCSIRKFNIPKIPFGEYTFIVKSNSTSGEKFLSTIFTCEPIDVSKLNFSFTPSPTIKRHQNSFKGVLKVRGLNSTCTLECIPPYYQLTDIGFGYYYIPNYNDFSLNDENVTFYFFNSSYTMLFSSVYKNYSNVVDQIKSYPNKENVTKLGKFQSPFFTFQTQFSSDDSPYYIVKPDFSYPVLLYGSEINNSYTYANTQQGGGFNLSLYSQNFNELVNVFNFFKNVEQYKLSTMPLNADISYKYIGNFTLFIVEFTNTDHYDFNKYFFNVNSYFTPLLQWPYGFVGGNNYKYSFRVKGFNLPISATYSNSITSVGFLNSNSLSFDLNFNTVDPQNPELVMFDYVHLFDSTYIFRITVKQIGENISISQIQLGIRSFSFNTMISGGNGNLATFEIIYDYRNEFFETITLTNSINMIKVYYNYDWYSIYPMLQIKLPILNEIDIFSINNISFLYNNVIISNEKVANIIYFNISNLNNNIPAISMILNDPVSEKNLKYYYSKWNNTLKMFQIEFFIPRNTLSGILPYSLFISHRAFLKSSLLPLSSQLYVKSKFLDSYGPIFNEFKNKTINSTTFGWEFYIEDSINGFDHGEIIVRGDLDSSIYKFQISSLNNLLIGNQYRGKYEILINLNTTICASQYYIITTVNLYDTQLNLATFSTMDDNQVESYRNPFIYYLDNPNILKHFKDCGNFIDLTPPIVNHFEIIKKNSDDGETLVFNIMVEDIESGLKYGQSPIVYLTSEYLEVVECISKVLSINSTNANYQCQLQVPYGFAFGCGYLIGVYGIINNGGSYMGFEENYNGSIMNSTSYPNLVITNSSSITSNGGDLWIMGVGFTNDFIGGYISIRVNYTDTKLTSPQILSPRTIYYSALLVSDIKATDKPFSIEIQIITGSKTQLSNPFIVNPVVFIYNYIEPTTTTPLPTNPPQKCLGSPVCGGLDHGYCNGLQGCVCYSPWVGLDCTSKVVVIPPPKLNSTTPTSELPVLGENNSNSTNILFKSLISIVSLRELNFQGNVENEFKFEKWIYTEINSNQHQYFTNISLPPTTNFLTTSTVDIKVTIQWFPNQTTIEFANQPLIMNPSTVKYTIEIGSYNFKNKLNQLQLVLSASMDSSNTKDICSKSEFGDTNSADNSNYVKIQVDNHSLYGRFIKRAIVDSQVISIENEQLDSSMNPINSASSSQSFIGITIPYYLYNIILDPDFSVLVDSKKVSPNDHNSICSKSSSSSNSSLTVSQLAGIIVASGVIFINITLGSKNLYPSTSDKIFCQFQLEIQTISTYGSFYSLKKPYSSDPYFPNNVLTSPVSTQTNMVFIYQILPLPYGTHSFTIYGDLQLWNGTDFNQTITSFIQTEYTCNRMNVNSLEFIFIPSIRSFNPNSMNMGVLKVKGLNSSCSLSTSNGYLLDKGSNNYWIFNFQTPISIATNPLNLTIWFADKTFYLNIPSLFKTFTGSLNSYTLYPNQINITRFGYNEYPLYSFTVNSQDYPYIFYDKFQRSPVAIVYGSKENYTFIGTLSSSGSLYKSGIYALQGDSINLIYNITTNISSFLINTIPSTGNVSTFSIIGSSYIFSASFNGFLSYDFNNYLISFQSLTAITQWPFGFSGSNKNFTFDSSFLLSQNLSTADSSVLSISPQNDNAPQFQVSIPLNIPNDSNTISDPILKDFQVFHLFDFQYLVRINLIDIQPYPIIAIGINDQIYRYENFASGDLGNGVFEIIWDYQLYINTISIRSFENSLKILNQNDLFSLSPNKRITFPTFKAYDINSINDITFLYNNINITNKSVSNIMYFKINGFDPQNQIPPTVCLLLLDPVSTFPFSLETTQRYFSKWNKVMGMFQVEFIIPANTLSGVIPYNLIFNQYYTIDSSTLSNSSQLFVYSNYFDGYGPIFSEIKTKTINSTTFGWEFYIEDPTNGFDHGEIIVRGDLDSSIYKFYLSVNKLIAGDKYRGKYEMVINLKTNICASQNYIITDVELYDSQGNIGIYKRLNGYKYDSLKTPFINYLDNPGILQLNLQCGSFIDDTPPVLKSFEMINLLNLNQSLIFNFEAQDIESGLKYDQYPIVYATTLHTGIIQCVSRIISINSTYAKYRCEMELPFGFAYGYDVIFTVYGFVNNGGYYSGYSYDRLVKMGLNQTLTSMDLYWKLVITNTSSITPSGGDLWVMGKSFSSVTIKGVNVIYSDTSLTPDNLMPIDSSFYSSVFLITGIKATNKSFTIQIISTTSDTSNIYTVHPMNFLYDYVDTTPPPTNPPQKCLGSPVCGGLDHGYCNGLQGCVCYPPWVGLGCTSKVVVIPPPKLNSTTPTSELPVLGENNSNSTNILFKSLISIVSLRELNFQGNVENEFKFEKWIYTEINSNQHQYFTTIDVPSINSTSNQTTTTNIMATIQWFPNQTTIQFANQPLIMNPSTVKYTIEIGSYNFKNKLNQLQLVLSASMDSSNTKDICSKSEFGDTNSADNSNYVKIQVDNHSLYGRFIKRAIVDSQVISIENEQLDSSMNPINSASSSQSFIGITIPYYRFSITLDPDFSVLVDDKSVSSGGNSICSKSSSLSNGQLAGIIVGAVGFASICIVALILLIKKRRHLLLILRAKDIVLAVRKPNYSSTN
ncbi:hypothetical protein ACTFIV_001626 [Dictyostelium citrinum]